MLAWCAAGRNKLGARLGSELYDARYGFSFLVFFNWQDTLMFC